MRAKGAVCTRNSHLGTTVVYFSLVILTSLISGCGGSTQTAPPQPQPAGKTQVMLLATSTGADEPFIFGINFASLSLKNEAGKSVSVFNYPKCTQGVITPQACLFQEFMELNGRSSLPMLTVTLPQGVYTSATMNVATCGLEVVGAASDGGAGSSEFEDGFCGGENGETTVDLPTPITISGASMELSLNLRVSQSYTLTGSGCSPGGGGAGATCTAKISPVFTLTPVQIAGTPTNSENGLLTGIDAQVQSVSSTGFTAFTVGAGVKTFNTDALTVFQGVDGLASLTEGEYVQADATIQPDGSLLATRVEVDDPTALYWASGVVVVGEVVSGTYSIVPGAFNFALRSALGSQEFPTLGIAGLSGPSSTAFKTSGEFTNLSKLPFPATFNAQTMVGGQCIGVFLSASFTDETYRGYPPATTITLLPQVVDGTVASISSDSGFTVYNVTLFPTDMIPSLQGITGPYVRPSNASSVIVYAGSNTQVLTYTMPAVGSVQRFRGLLFDDNGTLRMDCGQVLGGAPAPAM